MISDYEQYIEAENKKNTLDSSQPFSRFMPVPRPTELIRMPRRRPGIRASAV